MKKLSIALIAISFTAFACNEPAEEIKKTETETDKVEEKQQVNMNDSMIAYADDQKALMLFYTSTGCPGCGSWGSPTFENLAKQYPDHVLPLAIHIKYGDPMITPVSEAIASNRVGQYYTPQIWVDNTNIMVINTGRINGSESVQKAEQTILASSSRDAEAMLGNAFVIDTVNQKIHIKAGVENKGPLDVDDEYFLASYVLEDKIIWKQSSGSSQHEHNYVIRVCTEDNFGEPVSFNNNKFESVKQVDLVDYWKQDSLTVLTVLWKKVGARYIYQNAKLVKH